MNVYELMQKNVFTVKPTDSIKKTIEKMKLYNLGFIVIEEDKIPLGVITDRDLLFVIDREINLNTPIEKVMKKYVVTINQNDDISDASDIMGYLQIRRLVVTNDFGKITGVISVADLVKNVFSEEYGYEAITEISYDFSSKNDKTDKISQISAYKI